jgi:DNA polymerase III sliding clamp (beta) subunit (PCNA family)
MNIPKTALSTALGIACVALPRKVSGLVTSMVRIESRDGLLTVAATDFEQYAIGSAECVETIAPFCVSYKALVNLLPLMPESLFVELKDNRLNISGGGSFSLGTMSAEEFPSWDEKDSDVIGLNCAETLAGAIEVVSFACALDSIVRPVFYNVRVRCKDSEIIATACNGRELAQLNHPAIAVRCEFLIPSGVAHNFCEALRMDGAVLWLSGDKATVKHSAGEYSAKLYDGEFPDTDKLLEDTRRDLGEITPDLWLPILKSCMADEQAGKMTRIQVSDTCIKHKGAISTLEVPTPDKLKPCNMALSAKAFISCLEQLDGKAKLFLHGNNAIGIEQGNLVILSMMLRGE